nr:peptide chain release factor N(5)-glutamine methyltransferase [Gordonia humi]
MRRTGARRLADAGVDAAAHDAAELLAHVLGVEPGRLLLIDHVASTDADRYDEALARRAAREPLQHITGTAYFAGRELAVGPGVFVPRPETELIVEWAMRNRPDRRRVADLCSGSGALALALADRLPGADVVAVEKSEVALEYLRRNAADSGVHVVRGDVTDPSVMSVALGDRDLIVSNPPYVPAASPVSAEVRHDPADAVFSGETGMDVIDAMVPIVADALIPGGLFAVEHDDETADAVVATLVTDGRFIDVTAHQDLAGRPRFVTARRTGEHAGTDTDNDRARMEP